MGLVRFIARKITVAIPGFFVLITIVFFMIRLAPGDPVNYLLGEGGSAVDYQHYLQYVAEIKAKYGLDKPLHEQLLIYILAILHGDLGYSIIQNAPVLELILDRLPATLLLMIPGFVLAIVLGTVAGVFAAARPYSKVDNALTIVSVLGFSTPLVWLGQVLLSAFAVNLHVFPIGGLRTLTGNLIGFEYVVDILRHMVLPVVTLSTVYFAVLMRLTRANMLEVLGENYITTARSKGLSNRTVMYRHAFKNALLPVVTMMGMQASLMIGGMVVIENTFAWPGIGRLMVNALLQRDYPIILGVFMFIAFSVIIVNLAIDVIYSFLDPRIRYEQKR